MNATLKTTALACAFAALTTAGFAQDAAAPAIPTAETAKVGKMYLAETSEPWELRCTKVETGDTPCQMFQLLKDASGGDVAEFNIFKIPEGAKAAAGAVIVVPLETLLEAGLVMKVDENEARGYPFAFCNSYGCIARVGFTAEEVRWMKDGKAATISIVPALAPEARVDLTLSLKGFTAMYEKTLAAPE
ncbi:MAG: invasion associated locus B family protein [Cypionkella sp.]|nr:invasion associated locus B family protein [Cypionkella sp.]